MPLYGNKTSVTTAGPASDATPQPIGTAAAGTSSGYSRADHVHDLGEDPVADGSDPTVTVNRTTGNAGGFILSDVSVEQGRVGLDASENVKVNAITGKTVSLTINDVACVSAGPDGTSSTQIAATATRARLEGVVKTTQSDATNTGAGEDDLLTYSLTAASLAADGQSIEVDAVVTYAANANNKRVRLYFGATALYDTGTIAQNGGSTQIRARVVRTAAATQRGYSFKDGAGAVGIYTTPSETLSGAITIKATGEAVDDADITCKILMVRWLPANN